MWFLILFLLSVSPRLVLFIMWLATDYLNHAFNEWFWPVLGFIFMPWTTLWCAYVYNNGGFTDWHIVVLIICVLSDLSGDASASNPKA
jgi:hypothetical protein